MKDEEIVAAMNAITAIAVANKAMLTMYMAGMPITLDNAERVYTQWLDPNSVRREGLIALINSQIREMMDTANSFFPAPAGTA